ncbi:Por secretion system C-terminal sorting domain-containing protein [Psychroflexus salarius]|uniref:Por secretion system C-terminal sorting domain-containing protein n=1 Tax=Psychroflexus salarius TaxID=1155689 RepID=A0A1M4SY27_9FLAO|nr:alpha-amylase family glycosyl hydrolase [Psychroflexus salarius]SHE37070.1 Por secretion system C-terminal sorting domain-containing protein [Psychroflexus salarius]
MKKNLLLIISLLLGAISLAQQQTGNFTITPPSFEQDDEITITLSGVVPGVWSTSDVYLWAWYTNANGQQFDSPTNGSWTSSSESQKMTNNGDGTFSFTMTPTDFYGATDIVEIGMLAKAKDGTGDKKTQDFVTDVGTFQLTLNAPQEDLNVIQNGDNFSISASNSAGNATYVLSANGSVINTQTGINTYSYTDTNITENKEYILEVTQGSITFTREFSVIAEPTINSVAMPADYEDGINYISDTEAILVLNAPEKDFVYVAGSFNNWNPDGTYAMNIDPTRDNKFWISLDGLTPGQIETYQYWVVDQTPVNGSPKVVKTADPFSTLVLSPFDDPGIPTNSYPNLPQYPDGQEREVSVLQTAKPEYNWQVTDFEKPKKEDLVVYEVLVRDFDGDRNYQDLIDKINYFKDLNINAIHLMPVMEFEGNESWGYNTAFHMALDKFYGTENKLKEFIDLCHQNDIAVILDLVLNHAYGRNPMVRMWMNDPDGDGWGGPSIENPYFNTSPRHSYNVGNDFNHQSDFTQYYTERVIKHWIQEFKIDGFRWDLTKGFTQNCSGSNESCTNSYQQDRVDVLKSYADYSWSLDDSHYVIFEHLGQDNEEQQWANYRLNENKGIMLWGKMTDQYNQLTMGFNSNNDITRMGHESRGFNAPRLMGYAESHDEERLMYKNLEFGNTSNASHNVQNLNTALSRMSALGAVTMTIPGPKMIWHFGDLGMENSIFTCNDGSVNLPGGTDGDCKLDTKPQPQWTNNWLNDPIRSQIYNDWARLHELKIDEDVFEGDYAINSGNTLTPRIYVFDNNLPASSLKNVVVLANFDVTARNITPDFPYTGEWYDLMDETGSTSINVNNTSAAINIPAGEFRIYGNAPSTLSNNQFNQEKIALYPNPTSNAFKLSVNVKTVKIYNTLGKEVKSFKAVNAHQILNISELKTGLFFVQITDESDVKETLKLIKR